MYLNPSGNDVLTPQASIIINAVEPNMWWNGKNAKFESVSYIPSTFFIAYIFDAILFCESITAFDFDVVPDVNSKMAISYEFIFVSTNSLFPFS